MRIRHAIAASVALLGAPPLWASEGDIVLPPLGANDWLILWGVLGSALIGLGYGYFLVRKVRRYPAGTERMQEISAAIEEGAMAYLGQQFRTMIWFVLALTLVLWLIYRPIYPLVPPGAKLPLPFGIAMAFLMGVLASYGAGYVGMWLAVKANARTAAAALISYKDSLELGFRAGAVSGMFTVGFGLLGATIIFLLFAENAMRVLVGFGFGGSLAALFMRIGGGIYTKAADVGADLIGKVEAGIPEDDPRNAAVIADLVGDNVGDCAGMAADVFESYEVTLVAAIILGAAALLDPGFTAYYGPQASGFALKLVLFCLLVRALGVFTSILGIVSVRVRPGSIKDPMRPITLGYWVAALASVVGFFLINHIYLIDPTTGRPDYRFATACTMGIILALVTLWLTNRFTHPDFPSATETAYATRTGPATMLLTGMGTGMESTVWAILAIGLTILASGVIFGGSLALAAFGISLAGLGLLTTTGFILAMDTYGPITDNAQGIFEMARVEAPAEVGRNLRWLDAIGNTTKALTKGLAIATAVIAAISLFKSFIDETRLFETGIQINLPDVFVGLLIGGAVPFLFSSFALKAVGRASYQVVEEVRRQFREKPGIMEWKEKPDYGRCVSIVTATAQKELLGPGILGICTPILVAFWLGAGALGGYLAGSILTGQLLAVFMANTGATWDNAKKKIEDGLLGGKGTDAHKAAVVGDTVGDPFKDTAGPALNPLIKVMNLVAILVAPFAIRELGWGVRAPIIAVSVALLGLAVWFSKRGGIQEEVRGPAVAAAPGNPRKK
ncbi:MAG: sodium-translocating pyrophosphatase [Acidobacteria bacterium]|nr:sodium-translocating pyrophosphatase [Acidobacteriota bacterium]